MGNRRQFVCPFGGSADKGSGEHVWAQWRRRTGGSKALLLDSYGERIQMPSGVVRKGADGRYQTVSGPRGTYAKLLPLVQVRVCESCDTAWMSQLEDKLKQIVARLMLVPRRANCKTASCSRGVVHLRRQWRRRRSRCHHGATGGPIGGRGVCVSRASSSPSRSSSRVANPL